MAKSERKASHHSVQADNPEIRFLSNGDLASLSSIVTLEPTQYYQVGLQGLSSPDYDGESSKTSADADGLKPRLGWGVVWLSQGPSETPCSTNCHLQRATWISLGGYIRDE